MPKSPPKLPFGNRLLDALPAKVSERLRPHLESVALRSNKTIHEHGKAVPYAFFPTSGLISLIATAGDGLSVETGMIGKEGRFSVSSVLGDDRPSHDAVVQLPGSALRMPSAVLRRETHANAELFGLLLRFGQVVLSTASRTAACNRLHLLEQRFARWLLSAHDRAEADTFPMTQEFLAMMIGVRRPGVTITAQALRTNGLIVYNHGSMTILDRAGLEAASCDCYGSVQDELTRLLGPARR